MKKLLSILLFMTMVFVTTDVLAQYVTPPKENSFRSPERRYDHLEYFGFYASAMGNWNFTEKLSPYTNLTWIHIAAANYPRAATRLIIQRLEQARDAGVQATLSLEPFLFMNERGHLRSDTDIENFLVELRAQIEHAGLLDTVAMVYPKDEPFREFIRHRDPSFYSQYISGKVYQDIHESLVHVNDLIKLVFPAKPIGVILSGLDLFHNFFSIPENYDWVGFDCYTNLFNGCDNRSFVQLYARLLKFMQPHQRLMAVPETWAQNKTFDRPDWPEVLLSRLKHHYEIALNEPRFIAFIPFIWSFNSTGETPGLGLNRFQGLFNDGVNNSGTVFVNSVKRIGRGIKQGKPGVPNMTYDQTEDTKDRPRSNIRGEIMSINSKAVLSAWAINNALPHKNLRVQVLIRDASGVLLHESRLERTFIRDSNLEQEEYIGRKTVGNHGYRYQLPAEVLDRFEGQWLKVELVVYADGYPMEFGALHSLDYIKGGVSGGN
jgi:hypothetical protein